MAPLAETGAERTRFFADSHTVVTKWLRPSQDERRRVCAESGTAERTKLFRLLRKMFAVDIVAQHAVT